MYLIVGLGNPGRRYEQTRHNVGFQVVEALAKENALKWKRSWRYPAHLAKGNAFGSEILLAKPRTFMNRSGDAVGPLARRFEIPLDRIVVVVDDVELPCGRLRLRLKGRSGGHNGLKSIASALDSERYARLRVGVGPKPVRADMVNFVLSEFADTERETVAGVMETAGEAIRSFIQDGPERTMNRFNT